MSKTLKNLAERRAIGIVRVSRRNRNPDSRHSEEVQRRLILRFAKANGWELLPEDLLNENDIKDGDVSGGADLSDRPGFGPAVERLRRGERDLMVTADFSRFFRDIDVQRQVISQIEDAGGELWTVSNGRISHETADAELLANLQGSVSHYQRRYARDKSFLAVEIAIEQGKVPWHQTPPGYLRDRDSRLTPDPELRDVIVEAFELRAGGHTIADAREFLAGHGICRSYHGTSHLLRDRLYVGEIHHGSHIPNVAAHEPLLARSLFDAVQSVSVPRGRKPKSDRLLARLGILRCATCGGRMVVGTQTGKGRSYPFYRCGHVRQDCARRVTISAERAENAVIKAVREALSNAEGRASAAAEVGEAEVNLRTAQAALDAAFRTFDGFEDETAARTRLAELRLKRDQAQAQLDQLGGHESALSINADLDWDQLRLHARRALIRATISEVTVAPGNERERLTVHRVGE